MFGNLKRVVIKRDDTDFIPINNKVLVRIDDIVFKRDGIIVVGDYDFFEAKYCNIHGVVIKTPNSLVNRDINNSCGMEWGTEIEVKQLDEVWFTRKEAFTCPVVIIGEQLYYLVDYSALILAKRNNETIPLNGNVIFEKLYEAKQSKVLDLGFTRKENRVKARVVKAGRRNDWYLSNEMKGVDTIFDANVKEDDIVLLDLGSITLDFSLKPVLDDYSYIQGRWIKVILNKRLNFAK